MILGLKVIPEWEKRNDFLAFMFFLCFDVIPENLGWQSLACHPCTCKPHTTTSLGAWGLATAHVRSWSLEAGAVIMGPISSLLHSWIKERTSTPRVVQAGACWTIHLAEDATKHPASSASLHIFPSVLLVGTCALTKSTCGSLELKVHP